MFKETAFCKIFRSTKVRVRVGRSETVPGQFSNFSNASLSLNFGKEFEINDLEGIRILGGTWLGTKLIFWRFQLLYLQAKGTVPVKDDHVTKFRWITSVISVKCSRIISKIWSILAQFHFTVFQDFKFIFKYRGVCICLNRLKFH